VDYSKMCTQPVNYKLDRTTFRPLHEVSTG